MKMTKTYDEWLRSPAGLAASAAYDAESARRFGAWAEAFRAIAAREAESAREAGK